MAITLTSSYQKIATINLTYGKIYTYAKYTDRNISTRKTTYKIKSTYYTSQANGVSFSSATATLDGTSKSYGSTTMKKGETTIQELTRIITHNANGTSPTKTINTSWTASFGGSGSSSESIVAPKMNLIAEVTSGTDFNDEGNPTMTFTNPSGYTTRPYMNFYDAKSGGTQVYRLTRSVGNYASPYTWSITNEERQALREACNQKTTYYVSIGTETYDGSTRLGLSSLVKTFTIVNANPSTGMTIKETNPDVISILGTDSANRIIMNVSSIEVTPNDITTRKGATVSKVSYSGAISGESTTSPYTITGDVGNVDVDYIKTTLTDSRGLQATSSYYSTYIPYQKVKQNSFSFKRINPTSSDVRLLVDSVYYQQTFGSTANVPTVKYKIGDSQNAQWITVPSSEYDIDTENNELTVDYTIEDAIDYRSGDTFYVEVSDLLSSWSNKNPITSGIPVFEFGENEVQVNGDLLLADTDRDNVINVRDALGGGGTTDYSLLSNKPQINGVTLSGNKTTSDIGITIPDSTSDLTNDSGFITNSVNNLTNYTLSSALSTVATSGDYDDLTNKPTIPTVNNGKLTIGINGTKLTDFTANSSTNVNANITVPTKVSDLTNDSGFITGITSSNVTTALGYTPEYQTNEYNYADIMALTSSSDATYIAITNDINNNRPFVIKDYDNKYKPVKCVNDSVTSYRIYYVTDYSYHLISIPINWNMYPSVTDETIYLQPLITSSNKLNYNYLSNTPTIPDELADLSDDSTHRLVTDTEKSTWNNKSDFSGDYTDLTNKPTIPSKTSDLTNDSGYVDNTYHDSSKQDTLVSGTNIKTINNTSLLGSGNITIGGGGTATDVQVNGTSIVSNNTANITTSMIADLIYPVGSIYMSVNSTSPQTLFGGTWEQLKDRFLLGAGDTYTNGNTGGTATHSLTVSELASHTHGSKTLTGAITIRAIDSITSSNVNLLLSETGIMTRSNNSGVNGYRSANANYRTAVTSQYNQINVNATHEHDSVGNGDAFSIMPPYLVVYMWKRTA